jgi:hypothetical protein
VAPRRLDIDWQKYYNKYGLAEEDSIFAQEHLILIEEIGQV